MHRLIKPGTLKMRSTLKKIIFLISISVIKGASVLVN